MKIFDIIAFDIAAMVLYWSCFAPTVLNRLSLSQPVQTGMAVLLLAACTILLWKFYEQLFIKFGAIDLKIRNYCSRLSSKQKNAFLWVFILFFILLYLYRCRDASFWFDEAYGITNYARVPFDEVLSRAVREKTMPPFYNYVINILAHIFGQTAFIYHFSALIPVILAMIIAATEIKHQYGYKIALLFIVVLGISIPMGSYATEVRSYSWAMLFVFLCAYSAAHVLKDPSLKYKALFIISGVLGAYTHYFAFAAVCIVYGIFFIIAVIKKEERKEQLRFIVLAVIVSICAYIPWVLQFLNSVGSVTSGKSSEEFSLQISQMLYDSFANLTGQRGLVLWVGFFAVLLRSAIFFNKEKRISSDIGIMTAPFFGVALFGMIYDAAFRSTVFAPKYLLPAYLAALFAFVLVCSVPRYNYLMSAVFFILSFILFIPHYSDHLREEAVNDRLTRDSLQYLSMLDTEGTVFYADNSIYTRALFGAFFYDYDSTLKAEETEQYLDQGYKVIYVVLEEEKEKGLRDKMKYQPRELEALYLMERNILLYTLQ